MGITRARRQRCGSALFVVLALFASLFATAVPLVHALAHEYGHREAHAHGSEDAPEDHHAPSHYGEEHDEIHPASLHDEGLVVPRERLDRTVAPLPQPSLGPTVLLQAEAPFVASSALHSRAPPRTTPARAPPIV
jgi:hypothetical protein